MDALQPGDPGSVGGYRLLGRLGVGGMGQVFLGVSPGGRRVAVKLIHPAHTGTAQFRERFAREIEAAQRVGGFHTAPVVDADPGADPPWMVTAFIEGPSLQEDVERRGPLPPDGVRVLGAGLAEGLAAIHACGLVHRDLKPGNVILAADGPRIIDFGIARAIGATTGLTSTGVVVGTLTYMSPEQIRGDPVGPASDVFALGSVLAFAATGREPFGNDSAATVMFRIFTGSPALTGVADEHLVRVIGGCLAKAPLDRPAVRELLAALGGPAPTAVPAAPSLAVAAAAEMPMQTQGSAAVPGLTETGLSREPSGLAGMAASPPPERARPVGPSPAEARPAGPQPDGDRVANRRVTRGRRSRRKPAVIAAAATVVAAATAVIVAVSLSTGGTPPASAGSRESAAAALHRPATQARTGSPTRSGASPAPGSTSPSATASAVGDGPARDLTWHVPRAGGYAGAGIAFSPDGTTLALATAGVQPDYLYDASTGTRTATLTAVGNGASSVAFSPDGTLLAGSGIAGPVDLWNVASRTRTASLGADWDAGAAFSPNGALLAAGCNGANACVWDLATHKLILDLHTANPIYGVAFSPDGTLLAAYDDSGSTYLWRVSTGSRVAALHDPDGQVVNDAMFSPDGTLLAAADGRGSTYLWDVATGALVATLTGPGVHPGPNAYGVTSVAFSPDGTLLAAAQGSYVRFWDVASHKLAGVFTNTSPGIVLSVVFRPDGKEIAALDSWGYIYIRPVSQILS